MVLSWLVALITAGGLIDYIVMSATFLRFFYACKAQGVDRRTFPYYGRLQPYCGWIGLISESVILFFLGYTAFRPVGNVQSFFKTYTMVIICPILYFGWKFAHKTKSIPLMEVDLMWERPIVDAYEDSFTSPPVGFITEVLQMFGLRKGKKVRSHFQIATLVRWILT